MTFWELVDSTIEYNTLEFGDFSVLLFLTILFECENKCQCVSAFTVMFFYADTVQGCLGPDLQCSL